MADGGILSAEETRIRDERRLMRRFAAARRAHARAYAAAGLLRDELCRQYGIDESAAWEIVMDIWCGTMSNEKFRHFLGVMEYNPSEKFCWHASMGIREGA